LVSEQHNILAHRLPPDSMAAGAEAKSAAANNPEAPGSVDERELNQAELRETAIEDASRI
ncbi:hypothetical protein NEOLEDRAFT_1134342, partial [Neolentinus lepideus HHB14362 ss-1]